MKTFVTVRGFGGGINAEMLIIQKALEDYGFKVEVENEHKDWGRHKSESDPSLGLTSDEEQLSIIRERVASRPGDYEVKLVADHIPWGG